MTSSEINGLILIDCWEPDLLYGQASKDSKKAGKTKNGFFVNLVNNLERFRFTGIINAGTNDIKLSRHIKQYISTCSDVFNLDSRRDFLELRKLEHWKNINHWLVVGTSWRVCVHLNDIGLISFATSNWIDPKLNFYGVNWGFLKHNLETTTAEDFANDHLKWTAFEDLHKLQAFPTPKYTALDPSVAIRDKYINETPY